MANRISNRSDAFLNAALMPTQLGSDEGPTPELMVWGIRTPKSLLINTRAETALEKPTFAESARHRHCVIPSTGFFEWDGDKRKYQFTLPDTPVLYMAGIYDVREGEPCYSILTTAANDSMREVHDRMPLVLEREQIEPWLFDLKATESMLIMTPPVALASFAAAGLSGGSPMKTGWQSVRLALAGFIVPFMFVYNPALLLENVTFLTGIQVVVTACFGVVLIAAAVEGYLYGRMNVVLRLIAGVGAFLLIDSGLVTDLAGIACLAVIVLAQKLVFHKPQAKTA